MTHFAADNIDIYSGDIFELTGSKLGQVDAVYDRAALVAPPEAMRWRYADHLTAITKLAPQLLIAYEYDQTVQGGPPFSVSGEEVRRHYSHRFDFRLLASTDVPGGLKGKCPAKEHIWALKKV